MDIPMISLYDRTLSHDFPMFFFSTSSHNFLQLPHFPMIFPWFSPPFPRFVPWFWARSLRIISDVLSKVLRPWDDGMIMGWWVKHDFDGTIMGNCRNLWENVETLGKKIRDHPFMEKKSWDYGMIINEILGTMGSWDNVRSHCQWKHGVNIWT